MMKKVEQELTSEIKLNTLAKSIYNESMEMGFESTDYVKLMNESFPKINHYSRKAFCWHRSGLWFDSCLFATL